VTGFKGKARGPGADPGKQGIMGELRSSARVQLTHDVPLNMALTSDYRNAYTAIVNMLNTISYARKLGVPEKAMALSPRVGERIRDFPNYRGHLRSLLEEHNSRQAEGRRVGIEAAMAELIDSNPAAMRLDELAGEVPGTIAEDGKVDYARLKALFREMIEIYSRADRLDPDFTALDSAFGPFLE